MLRPFSTSVAKRLLSASGTDYGALMNRAQRVATLAVGTEIIDGQISDRNSQWLSAQVVALGYEVIEHRAVADDHEKILRSLRELSLESDLLFVTGGLGPTSDDFTRECVARFLNEPLEWDESSWNSILDRLKARGASYTENQKQQCFYPRGAQILKNSGGTANGFTCVTSTGTRVVVLPGPPREIETIWNSGLSELLKPKIPMQLRELTLLRTMGLGEGALASRVEEILDQVLLNWPGVVRPSVGYRAHAPYVEIKMWADPSQVGVVAEAAQLIRSEFKDVLVNEGEADVADDVISKITRDQQSGRTTCLIDGVSQGQILQRLLARAASLKDESALAALDACMCIILSPHEFGTDSLTERFALQSSTTLLKIGVGPSNLELYVGRNDFLRVLQLPKLAVAIRSERGRKWAVELALREWGRS